MSYGGIESFIMSYLRNMNLLDWKIHLIQHGVGVGVYDRELEQLGCKLSYVTPRSHNLIKNSQQLALSMRSESYDIVWSHMDAANYFALKAARKAKIPVRISHSHNTQLLTQNVLKKISLSIIKQLIPFNATHLFACSHLAGSWLYGKKPFTIIPNAIESTKYHFNQQDRNITREMLGIPETSFVIGNIGRFDYQKNHQFLIKIFFELVKKEPNTKLLLVGDGEDFPKIQKMVRNSGFSNDVFFLGRRTDIPALLSSMDCFVLPSHFEGLGIVLLEAQANGLPCIVSSVVPHEVAIQGMITFINLDKPIYEWVSAILEKRDRINYDVIEAFDRSGFEIKSATLNLENKLKTCLASK